MKTTMLRAGLCGISVLLLAWATTAQAAPLDLKQVPAKAKGLLHVDVDAAMASPEVKTLHDAVVAAADRRQVEAHRAKLQHFAEQFHLDFKKDVHGVTMFGPGCPKHEGVVLLNANLNQKLLEEKAKALPDYKVETYGRYQIATCSYKAPHHGPMGKPISGTAAAAFFKPNLLVLGSNVAFVKMELDVLDGKEPSMADKPPAFLADVPKGAIVVAAGMGIAETAQAVKSPALKKLETVSFVAGAAHGELYAKAELATTSPEIKTIIEGFRAMVELGGNPAVLKYIRFQMNVAANTVYVECRAPAKTIAYQIAKCGKKPVDARQTEIQKLKAEAESHRKAAAAAEEKLRKLEAGQQNDASKK